MEGLRKYVEWAIHPDLAGWIFVRNKKYPKPIGILIKLGDSCYVTRNPLFPPDPKFDIKLIKLTDPYVLTPDQIMIVDYAFYVGEHVCQVRYKGKYDYYDVKDFFEYLTKAATSKELTGRPAATSTPLMLSVYKDWQKGKLK